MTAKLDHAGKVTLAESIAERLIKQDHVRAVLLVGSVATGTDTPDSDLDLAVFSANLDRTRQDIREQDGVRIGIEYYPAQGFIKMPPVPLLDVGDLRDCGRFSRGRVLASRWPQLDQLRDSWRKALLHPRQAARLFGSAARTLDSALRRRTAADRMWSVQGAAYALAIIALSMQRCRYQKPKWVLPDLEAFGAPALAEALRSVYLPQRADANAARGIIEVVGERLAAACRLAGLPPLSYQGPDENAVYVYMTFRDALSLSAAGKAESTALTALYALRLMNSLLKKSDCQPKQMAKWRERSFQALYGSSILTRQEVEQAAGILRPIDHELRKRYHQKASALDSLTVQQRESVQRLYAGREVAAKA